MIKYNVRYSINKGNGSIEFTEGKQGTVNASYETGLKEGGVINGVLEGNTLRGNFHNKGNNSSGLIEIVFDENGFNAKWKQGLEPGPMRGKWTGSLNAEPVKETTTGCRPIGIYSAIFDEDEELIESYEAGEKPALIAIGFFDTHLKDTYDEWYGFVGYIVTNTIDKYRTESVLFMDKTGQTASAHDMGGEAMYEDDLNLVEYFQELYPAEWEKIQEVLWEYFQLTEEDEDSDELYLTCANDIPENIRLSTMFSGDMLDLEEVKTSSGTSVGFMITL